MSGFFDIWTRTIGGVRAYEYYKPYKTEVMGRKIYILAVMLLAASVAAPAQSGVKAWITTEGAGIMVTGGDEYGPVYPVYEYGGTYYRHYGPHYKHGKKAKKRYKKMKKARKEYLKARHKYYKEMRKGYRHHHHYDDDDD